jgi:eukaryotic-like serine/threonine-protein kinase
MIGKTISHYTIVEKLGEGGMGIVYKAHDTKLNRTVALKFLSSHGTPSDNERKRFIHEAQSASTLEHPNICTIHEIDETSDGQLFIVMPCYEGETLEQKIERGGTALFPFEEAFDIAIQIANGLRAAHEKEIVHRDIKSSNIFITAKGQIKIMDFGLARSAGMTQVTKTGMTIGTVPYMSPEQARGEKVDHRTDIWSFGVVLYEMLTGQRPFKGDYEHAIVYSIINEDPQSIIELRNEIPREAVLITEKMLQKQPHYRYGTMGEVLNDLCMLRSVFMGIKTDAETVKTVPSIAVLPFVDMSAQRDQEYFCDGIAEELINALSHIKGLHVVARTSAFAFKGEQRDVREIGKKLNVNSVLEGSIRKAGNRLRFTAQLINVADGFHLWSEKFDRSIGDIFDIQDELTMSIVDHLKVTLLSGEKTALEKHHTNDPEAYTLYLKGLYFSSKPSPESFETALEYFRLALVKDPNFALPYAGIAHIYGSYGVLSFLPPQEVLPKAKEALHKAVQLDYNLAEAYAISAVIAFWFEWDWKASENYFKKALSLNPGTSTCRAHYAWYQLAMGRFDEALAEIKRAQELDPLVSLFYAFGTSIHHTAGNFDEGLKQFDKAIELDPNNGLAYFHMGRLYYAKGMMEEARSAFQKSLELAIYSGWAESYLGSIYNAQGNKEKAENILNELIGQRKKKWVSSICIGLLAGELNKMDMAFEYFNKAFEERDTLMPFINIFREYDRLRKDPRFKTLLQKMRFET